MPPTVNLAPANVFDVSHDDIQRFNSVATISDEAGFARALTAFILEKFQSVKTPPVFLPETNGDTALLPEILSQLNSKARALRASGTWQASASELQRGRMQMLKEFNAPGNLPLAQYAQLANKSRQQLYKDVAAKRLLALSIGNRGLRIPDWQLTPDAQELTRQLLAKAGTVDEWTLFHALAEPYEALQHKSPITAVSKANLNQVLATVLNKLGLLD